MPVFKPRNRLVNFRLSEEEFEKLRASCALNGARSLSDFARAAVMRSVATGQTETLDTVATATSHAASVNSAVIDRKVHDLESRVYELGRLMESLKNESVPVSIESSSRGE